MKYLLVITGFVLAQIGLAQADDIPDQIDASYFALNAGNDVRSRAANVRQYCRAGDGTSEKRRPCMDACFMLMRVVERDTPQRATYAQQCADAYNAFRADIGSSSKSPEELPQAPGSSTEGDADSQDNAPETAPQTTPAEKITYTDPAAEHCASNKKISKLWDCGCVDKNAPAARAAISERLFESNMTTIVPRREAALAKAQEQLSAEQNPVKVGLIRKSIERTEQQLVSLKQKPDPSSHSVNPVINEISTMNVCRMGEEIAQEKLVSCQSSASMLSGIDDKDAYCECMAEGTAAAWTTGKVSNYDSNAMRNINLEIDRSCRS